MLSIFIFAPCYVHSKHIVLSHTMRCEPSALDIIGMLWAGVLDVIILRMGG